MPKSFRSVLEYAALYAACLMFSLLFFAFFQGTWYYQQVNLLAMFFAGLVLALLPYHLEKKSDKFLAFPLVIIPAARFLAFLLGIF